MSALLSLPMGGGSINVEHFNRELTKYEKYTFNFTKPKNISKSFYLIGSEHETFITDFTSNGITVACGSLATNVRVQVIEFI